MEILVEVEQRHDARVVEQINRRGDAVQVGVVVLAGGRLDRRPDHADADRVDAFARQQRHVVGAEPDAGQVVGRELVHHVHAVYDDHATRRIRDPAARVRERLDRRRERPGSDAPEPQAEQRQGTNENPKSLPVQHPAS
jgi:hypothetical protein